MDWKRHDDERFHIYTAAAPVPHISRIQISSHDTHVRESITVDFEDGPLDRLVIDVQTGEKRIQRRCVRPQISESGAPLTRGERDLIREYLSPIVTQLPETIPPFSAQEVYAELLGLRTSPT